MELKILKHKGKEFLSAEMCPFCSGEHYTAYLNGKCPECGKRLIACNCCDCKGCVDCKWGSNFEGGEIIAEEVS